MTDMTCPACWQHLTAAIHTVYGLAAPLSIQELDRLYKRHPTVPLAEHRVRSACQGGRGCHATATACQAWVNAWQAALATDISVLKKELSS